MRVTSAAIAVLFLAACSSTTPGGDGGAPGATCTIGGATVAEGAIDPTNPCRSCQVAVSTTDWTPFPTGTFCNDPVSGSGFCNLGACEPGCYIGGAFLPPGAPNPSASCQSCVPETATTNFSPATGLPPDGGCAMGTVCSQGACAPGCFIGSAYHDPGAYNPSGVGQCCAPLSDLDGGVDGGLRGGVADWTPQFGYGELLSGSSVGTAVVAGDFAGNGRNDLALFGDPNSVALYFNLGEASFGPGPVYATGIHPVGAVTADFDGDGRADLATVTQNDGLIGLFMNSGGGVFVDGGAIASPAGAIALALGDFNGDGHPDLAYAEGNPSIALLINANNGSFVFTQPSGPIDAGAGVDAGDAILWQTNALVHSMAAADFNGDGKTDLMVVEQMTNQVGLFLNDGNGGFGPRADFDVGSTPASGVAGDFNGDGLVDFAVVNTADQPATIGVLLNDGAGGFGPMIRYPTNQGATAVITSDFNGDGRLDLAVVSSAGRNSALGVLYGLPDGGLSSQVSLPTGQNLGGTAADFKGHQGVDLAVFGSRFVSLLLNACR